MKNTLCQTIWIVVIATVALDACAQPGYDPLALQGEVATNLLFHNDTRRARKIPLKCYLPVDGTNLPVILFSHGLGGSREASPYLGNHYASRGFVVIFLQHSGSDEAVWKSKRPAQIYAAMKQAASGANLILRAEDILEIVDQLRRWNSDANHALFGRLDCERIGICGHSFGARSTQVAAGQSLPLVGQKYQVSNLKAALAFSPSSPARGSGNTFSGINLPFMVMTGTKDDSPVGDQTPEQRREVFPALPTSIDRYELVLFDAQHSAFGERRGLRARNRGKNPNHHRAILALSTAFWDAYLRNDAAAKQWLQGPEALRILEANDSWQFRPAK